MKNDLIFAPVLLVIGLLLCLFSFTGMIAHILVSVAGVFALAAYTALTKKDWKLPALEIAPRASYGVALLSGIIIKINYVRALAVIHKIFAVLFMALIVVLLTYKVSTEEKK